MKALTQNQGLRAEGRIKLISIYQGKELISLYPNYGPDSYVNIGSQIEKDGLAKPNMAETVSLVHSALVSKPDNKYSKEIKGLIHHERLFGFTRSRYEPTKGGVFVYDEKNHEKFNKLNTNKLEQILSSNEQFGVVYNEDGSLRFVPYGFKEFEMTPLKLSENAYVIALAGKEGAEKLAEVAYKLKDRRPFLNSFTVFGRRLVRVSSLHYEGNIRHKLHVDGLDGGSAQENGKHGGAFGIERKN